jgi:serine/threonine-protein kinase
VLGRTISHYRILEKLGEGGMGVVYRAEDTKLKRPVALKFLPSELTRDPEAKERFIQEAQAASALDHPNICNIHEIGETDDGQSFIAMACYDGETLKKKIARRTMSLEDVVRVAIEVGEGLAKAHAKGIVHRDIKPDNVFITDDGTAKILDFGLAKLAGQVRLTRASSTLGTVAYMSPEQAGGQEIDTRTDIWSLGVVLYEMISGRLPFRGEHEQAMMYSILNEEPLPLQPLLPDLPAEIRVVLSRALAKRPEDRYQHVDEMLVGLSACRKKLETRSATDASPKSRWSGRRLPYLSAGLVLVAALLVLGRLYLWPASRKPIDSIAVLPLQNLSGDVSQEYFSDGMTEALITELQKIKSLRVISRTSVMQYKNTRKLLPQIARELNVSAVVEGSVLREGDNVRINVQLIQASPEKHLWAENFDRSMRSILALQSDVAQAITREIRAVVTPEEQKRMASSRAVDPEAHEAYLKGRFYWNKRRAGDLKTAIDYFNEAIKKDSTYAVAYAGLASTYLLLPQYAGVPQQEAMPKAESAAMVALGLDPTLAEPHAVLGLAKASYEWDWAGAESEFRRAIELDPNYPIAHHWYANYLEIVGRSDEALREARRALELDPLSLIINENLGSVLIDMGRYEEGIDQINKTLALDTSFTAAHGDLARAYLAQHKPDKAIAEAERTLALGGPGPPSPPELAELGYFYARAGRRSDAQKALLQLLELSKKGVSVSTGIALVYHGLGDVDKSFEWAEKACQTREAGLTLIAIAGRSDSTFSSDPRFLALLERMGLKP